MPSSREIICEGSVLRTGRECMINPTAPIVDAHTILYDETALFVGAGNSTGWRSRRKMGDVMGKASVGQIQ